MTCLSIERYDFATNGNLFDTNASNKALLISIATHRGQAPKDFCDFEECVRLGQISHYKDKCWKKYPNFYPHALRPKNSLNRLKTKETSGGNGNTASQPTTSDCLPSRPTLTSGQTPPDITS